MRVLKRSPRWAAQAYEQQIYGMTPNIDFLRAMQVSDSQPVSPEFLMVLNARVIGKGGSLGSPIEVEAVRPETRFELDVKLDQALYSDWARRHHLRLSGKETLENLPAIVNARTLLRARREAAWFNSVPGTTRVLRFYQQLTHIQPDGNQFVMQLGWGTGWDDKTFGDRLTQDLGFMEQAVTEFGMARGSHRSNGTFPSSRRVAVAYRKDAQENITEDPAYPLGWVLVTFEKIRGDASGWKSSLLPSELSIETPLTDPVTPQKVEPKPPVAAPKPAVENPSPQKVKQPLVSQFTTRPEVGQRFYGVVLDPDSQETYLEEVPGLPEDLWTGILSEPGRTMRAGEKVVCQVTAVRPDPMKKGAWLVICRLV